MSVVLQAKQIANGVPPLTADGADDTVTLFGDFALTAALAVNNIIEMVELPAGYVPVDVILDTADLDTGGSPTIVLAVGVMAGTVGDTTFANRTTGAEFITASTVGQAGGVARLAVAGGTRVAPTDASRSIGVKVTTGPATGATSGSVRLTVLARPARHGL